MTNGFIVVIAILIFVLVTLAKGIRIVPQGEEWIVERLGKYHMTLLPGLTVIVPYLDRIAYKLVTKDIILEVQRQEVITKDNAVIAADAIAFIKVTDPVKASYGVVNFSEAIRNLIMTTLRSIIGEMDLDSALASRDRIKARLRESIADEVLDWGLSVKSVELQDISPSESMQRSMELQASAERSRKATVTQAEGAKQAAILQADGAKQAAILQAEARLEAAKRDALAQVQLAEASAQAIQRITAALGNQDGPMRYLLGEKYLNAMNQLASSKNAKTVVLPADLQDAIRGIFTGRNI
jgi:regulator of protease activity HflC (stomatin/prohibitin superfamily)